MIGGVNNALQGGRITAASLFVPLELLVLSINVTSSTRLKRRNAFLCFFDPLANFPFGNTKVRGNGHLRLSLTAQFQRLLHLLLAVAVGWLAQVL